MKPEVTCFVAAIGLALVAGAADANAQEPRYVGAKKCRSCHKKELIGDQYGKWKQGKHSQAYETLRNEDSLKVAKEKGLTVPPWEAEECLNCHVSAYGEDASKFARKPFKPEEGVQCESCHGPGSLYKRKKIMSDHDKAVAAGLWEADKDEKICTTCHNEESPTAPEEGFDFEKLRGEIDHPIPEDVKGRYIEIEKKLKVEKKAGGDISRRRAEMRRRSSDLVRDAG